MNGKLATFEALKNHMNVLFWPGGQIIFGGGREQNTGDGVYQHNTINAVKQVKNIYKRVPKTSKWNILWKT